MRLGSIAIIIVRFLNYVEFKDILKDIVIPESTSTAMGPFWDSDKNMMLFVDHDKKSIRSFYNNTFSEGLITVLNGAADYVSFAMPVYNGPNWICVGLGKTVGFFKWGGRDDLTVKSQDLIYVVNDAQQKGMIIRTGATDCNGLLWLVIGHTDNAKNGSLVSVSSLNVVSPPIAMEGVRDGIAFDASCSRFYFTDSEARAIKGCDYNMKTSSFAEINVVYKMVTEALSGTPTGLTVDNNGILWVACSNNVLALDIENGVKVTVIPAPAGPESYTVTSVAIGGSGRNMLFATTAGTTVKALIEIPSPNAAISGWLSEPAKLAIFR